VADARAAASGDAAEALRLDGSVRVGPVGSVTAAGGQSQRPGVIRCSVRRFQY